MDITTYISGFFAMILLILGIWTLVFKSGKTFWKMIPGIGRYGMLLSIIAIVLGIAAGGIAYASGFTSGLFKSASVTTFSQSAAEMPIADLQSCVYSTATGIAGNVTVRQDPNSNNVVFLDVDESSWDTNGKAKSEVNVTFKCARTGDISEDAAVEIVAKGDVFKSEISTTDASEYNILQTSSRPSEYFPGKYTQTIYLAEGTSVTTSDTKERTFLTFAEGEKELSLSLLGEADATSFANLNNYTQKSVVVYKRINNQDSEVARIIVNKIP